MTEIYLNLWLQAASVSGWAWAEGAPVDVGQEPRHLARIAAKGPAHVAATAMSADGAAIAFCQADPESVRLFRLAAAPVSQRCCSVSH